MKDKKNLVENTTKKARENPAATVMQYGVVGFAPNSNAIEASEKRGQEQLVKSDLLPTKGLNKAFDAWRGLGFKVGDPVTDDDIFTYVELPRGWKKVATDHDMWSSVVDDKGRKRASVFYKAAFYDRSAYIHVQERFIVTQEHDKDYKNFCGQVLDGEEVIFSTSWAKDPTRSSHGAIEGASQRAWHEREVLEKAQRDECEAFLDQKYPNWRDTVKAWDE